jgi:photosystem II stability/assembly factor-like uncharacterized protein
MLSFELAKPSSQATASTYENVSTSKQTTYEKFEERDTIGTNDDPAAYWKWFYNQRADHNKLPANAYGNAVTKLNAMKAIADRQTLLKNSMSPVAPPSNLWTSVGPSPIDAGGGNFYSGRVTALAPDPSHAGTVYLGAAQGGVWKSTDSGNTWTPLTDNQATLATGSIAVDSSGNVYVGTGEGNLSCDSYYGAGILKSTNGGTTWTRLGITTFGSSTITKILVNASNTNIILASTNSGQTSSGTNSCTFIPTGSTLGIYRSTNGGSNWSLVKSFSSGVNDIVSDPTNPQVVYAAAQGDTIYKSIDGGLTWNPLTIPLTPGRIALGITAQPQVTLFAAIQNNIDGVLYESTTGGASWSPIVTPSGPFGGSWCHGQCWYDIFIVPDPTNANILYLGGQDLYRSTNGGVNWTDMGGYSGNIHPDQHALAFDPASHSHIYSGNDGGIWSATAGDTCTPSSCWTQKNTGLTITQFQSIAAHPSVAGTYFGGTQDNGSPEHTTSTTWTELVGGDGGWSAFDPNTPTTIYHTFFMISPQRSDDGGSTWSDITTGLNMSDSSSFYIPMANDKLNPSILFLGTDHLYKTVNKGNSWSATSLVLSNGFFSAIKVAPSDDAYVYAGTSAGTLFVSKTNGTSFTEKDTGLPSKFLTYISVDSSNPQIVYATFSGVGGSHVFVSSNAGTTWTDITSNLPDTPTNVIAANGGILFIGTDIGPFVSTNGGTSWSTLGSGFPTVTIFDMAFTSDGKLLAATHGRGTWLLDLSGLSACIPFTNPSIVTTTCTQSSNITLPGDLIVQPGAVLTIPNGVTLNLNFGTNHLLVKSGGGVLIKAGGRIN